MASFKFGGALKELRIHLCQTGKHSEGVRQFIEKNYVSIKKENPDFPILIRERTGIQPKVWARFENCEERSISLTGMNSDRVIDAIVRLIWEKGAETSAPLTNLDSEQVADTIKKLASSN